VIPGWEGELPVPAVRTIGEMREVLADPACMSGDPLYLMYRDLAKSDADWRWLRHHRLRYDLTVIPPRDLCGEYVKTKGHYHPKNPAGVGYPELYEVLGGRAQYLIQSRQLDHVVLITAETGDIVIIPPEYGHISINPSPDATLVMANIVSTEFESDYTEYEDHHGAAYYVMSNGRVIKNPHYPVVPPLRETVATCRAGTQRFCHGPIYSMIGNGEALAFLNRPEDYQSVFTVLIKD